MTRSGRWLVPYSPYNTFDPQVKVDRSQVVVLWSDDDGQSWRHTSMLRFADPHTSAAEAWVVELSDSRLLGACWHIADRGGELPNAFGISHNGGETWSPTRSTGILGQTTALAPWTDGRAIFLYNQRKHSEPGVWLAVVRPTDDDFGIEHNEIVWKAQTPTRSASSGDLSEWNDFSFGEPIAALLPDGTWLVTLWCIQPSGTGIRYLRLKIE
ncbi:MAG: exo-alpha-sialidase [Rhodopirellula sp.]|nr:exo-alpha-sialidase [Rhodopirellula sp.]